MADEIRVRIPRIQNIDRAIEIYNSAPTIGNADIRELFGVSKTTATALKELGRRLMKERGIPVMMSHEVSVDCAFEAWGLNIKDLMQRQLQQDKIKKRRLEWGIESHAESQVPSMDAG